MGRPSRASQTIVVARWFVMPMASTSPSLAKVLRATESTASPMAAASNSTTPGAGVEGSEVICSTVLAWAFASTIPARTDDVPTSITRTLP